MNNAAIKKLSLAQSKALELTAESVKTEVMNAQVMPFKSGTMQNESVFIDNRKSSYGKVSITLDTPYARRLYFHPEYNFSQEENPNAQGRWFDPWIDGEYEDFAIYAYRKFYKQLTGV